MPHKNSRHFKNNDFSKNFNDLPIIPRPGPGRESRNNTRPIGFLKEVSIRARSFARLGSKRGPSKGRSSPQRATQIFNQRVLIKSRVVLTKGKGGQALSKHTDYLQREGVGERGLAVSPFNEMEDLNRESIRSMTSDWGEDRHHFRFIVSPELGKDLDLKRYTRTLMRRMSSGLDTSLEWIGVAHHNTDNPHVHIVLRGKDEQGKDLVLQRDFIAKGMRYLAEDIATLELGFRNEFDIQRDIQKSLYLDKVTPIDRTFEKEAGASSTRLVDLRVSEGRAQELGIMGRTNRLARLQYLKEMGLANEVDVGVWRIEETMVDRLERLGTKNDVIKLLHRRIRGISEPMDVHFVNPTSDDSSTVVGAVIHKGIADELYDRRFILVEGTDKRIHHVMLPESLKESVIPEAGDTVSVRIKSEGLLRKTDQNIADFAANNAGIYHGELHEKTLQEDLSLPRGVTVHDYVENHRRRLNSLVRMGLVEEVGGDNWKIPVNLVDQLSERRRNFLSIEVLVRGRGQELGREI